MLTFNQRLAQLLIALTYAFAGLTHSVAAQAQRPTFIVTPGIYCSGEAGLSLSAARRQELADSLRRITGWADLRFTDDGRLVLGDIESCGQGSLTARRILQRAVNAKLVFLIEDHSGSASINFGQLDEGLNYEEWQSPRRVTIFRLRLDFADFREMQAGPEVREAFDAGFTLLHEVLHGLGYWDTKELNEIGECEGMVNRARAELGLPLRDQYLPDQVAQAGGRLTLRMRFKQSAAGTERKRTQYLFFSKAAGDSSSADDQAAGAQERRMMRRPDTARVNPGVARAE